MQPFSGDANSRMLFFLLLLAPVVLLGECGSMMLASAHWNSEFDRCALTAPTSATGWHARWEWWPLPPDLVCIYTDRSGKVVAERRSP